MTLPKIIAHRGVRAWAPENTLAAFEKSLELKVDGIELDVQRCATGELVVFHDEELSRTTNGAGLLKDSSFAELRRLSAGSWYDSAYKDERIPLLSEVLDLVAGQMVINIELKNAPEEYPGINEDLLEVLCGYPKEKLIISSFDLKLMRDLNKQAPELNIALLAAAVFVDLKRIAAEIGAKYYHPAYDCFRTDVAEEARLCGLAVNVWTCNTQAQWRNCVRMQLEGIVTDEPEALKKYFSEIGAQAAS